jgi:hypothetical protein
MHFFQTLRRANNPNIHPIFFDEIARISGPRASASEPLESEGVDMREPYTRAVMEHQQAPASNGLSDPEVIGLWLRRQRSSFTLSA